MQGWEVLTRFPTSGETDEQVRTVKVDSGR
jgi:hypothetical protein